MFFIAVSLCDVRLSHLNKDYLFTYLLLCFLPFMVDKVYHYCHI